jgi:hypothetical protein
MPKMDMAAVWVTLSEAEATDLLRSLLEWADEMDEAGASPAGWHTHLTDGDGRELTIAIGEGEPHQH